MITKKSVDKKHSSTTYRRKKQRIFKKFNYTCQVCGYSIQDIVNQIEEARHIARQKNMALSKETRNEISKMLNKMQVHHIKSIRNGGSDREENLIVLCNECHDKIHGHVKVISLSNKKERCKRKGRDYAWTQFH